jgi:hypothetical protein
VTNTWRGALLIAVRMLADDYFHTVLLLLLRFAWRSDLLCALEFVCAQGIELCGIVETIYSLGVLHKVQGDVAFADRAEMIAYNAQPAAMTSDMWARNYLSQINEIAAVTTNPHPWITDGPASTTYGLEPNFPCCTANHNQGWPKWVLSMVTVEQIPNLRSSGGTKSGRAPKLLITGWGPLNVTIPAEVDGGSGSARMDTAAGAGILSIDTDYPFGDTAVIRTEGVTRPFTLALRIPGWATGATLTVYAQSPSSGSSGGKKGDHGIPGRAPVVVPCSNGTYHDVEISAGSTILSLDFRPQIRLSYGWGPAGTNAVAVMRGSLVYALPLEEHYVVTGALLRPAAVSLTVLSAQNQREHRQLLSDRPSARNTSLRSSACLDFASQYCYPVCLLEYHLMVCIRANANTRACTAVHSQNFTTGTSMDFDVTSHTPWNWALQLDTSNSSGGASLTLC